MGSFDRISCEAFHTNKKELNDRDTQNVGGSELARQWIGICHVADGAGGSRSPQGDPRIGERLPRAWRGDARGFLWTPWASTVGLVR